MGRMTAFGWKGRALGVCLALGLAAPAGAIYLDENQNISLRARVYDQAAIRTEGSYDNTTPRVVAGQLVQDRHFFNPELEAKLASYTSWMKEVGLGAVAPDSFDFRLAGWAFYDGLYDYGPSQFKDQVAATRARFFRTENANNILRGTADEDNPRDIFVTQRRVNELYLSYTKGPLFVRLGRQAISWGESDTVALLDQNNPFDLTLGAPGVFEDVDEARIPLWTIRSSYSLFDSLGPLSSGFVEAYWVPGDIDQMTAIVPPPTLGPYVAPGPDPRSNPLLNTLIGSSGALFVVDDTPASKMANSRYGFRVQAVVGRDYTVSAWFYTAFNQAPVPRLNSVACTTPDPKTGKCSISTTVSPRFIAIDLVHQLVPVVGVSNTFFFQPLNGIIRMEAEYFNHEPGFIPSENLLIPQLDGPPYSPVGTGPRLALCPGGAPCPSFQPRGSLPHADFLRWEVGYDRFFFFRPLNPTNSFVWVTAVVGQYNISETSRKDFYYDGQQKPGTYTNPFPVPSDFVQQQKVELFGQTHLQTDYMHGRLTPQVTFRLSDSLLFDLYYVNIGGAFTQLGFFRDRDQLAVRATLQLN